MAHFENELFFHDFQYSLPVNARFSRQKYRVAKSLGLFVVTQWLSHFSEQMIKSAP